MTYEWKPVTCAKCKQLCHAMENCRQGQDRQRFKESKNVDSNGFQQVVSRGRLGDSSEEVPPS